ncbi:MAG: DUF3108 domain-containing protein [Verrucomicrobiae bacterium]|nr:DUF3108 domain-containing protein [Verrucomicrobiae bacterium]
MRRSFAALLIFASLAADASAASSPSDRPYADGERLTYHFYWGMLMVGKGIFEIRREKTGIEEFTVTVRSNGLIAAIYPVEDVLRSRFDPARSRGVSAEQIRREGPHRVWEQMWFYHDLGRGWMQSLLTGETKWFEISSQGVVDKLSLIYLMRRKDWRAADRYRAHLGSDRGSQTIEVRKIGAGIVTLDEFPPIAAFGVEPDPAYLRGFVKRGKMQGWLSDDDRKIPLKVISKLPVGAVTAHLTQAEGVGDWPTGGGGEK